MSAPVLELADVVKDYHGLRPLRIKSLSIAAGETVAVMGVDAIAAEVLVNLITGATLPDTGRITLFEARTADISDASAWLTLVDRVGIVSERAVLLDGLTTIQNLCVPFTLDIEPPPEDVRVRAAALAREVELAEPLWESRLADLDAGSRARVRLARALALDPGLLLFEHATAALEPDESGSFGDLVRLISQRRGAAVLAVTASETFARRASARVLTLDPRSGQARDTRGWRSWLP